MAVLKTILYDSDMSSDYRDQLILTQRKHKMLDLIVIVVTVISFFALIELTIGCDRL
jgi:hypothetical protein